MSTYSSIHLHVIFSTKHREPTIKKDWIDRLHEYAGGTIKGLDAVPVKVGGVADHMHLLVGCKTTQCAADLVREIKKSTTCWLQDTMRSHRFSWQDGYAVFSVSPSVVSRVASYIANQEEHHRRYGFRDELEKFLRDAGIVYDPKYLD